jgi:hypothetical protein
MNNKPVLQELGDDELALVTGARNVTRNVYINITKNYYSIVYAPVYVYGTVSYSNINSYNAYTENSKIRYR